MERFATHPCHFPSQVLPPRVPEEQPLFRSDWSPEKMKNLAMEICSIPSMCYITGVKAYGTYSISRIGIQTRQYVKVLTSRPYLVQQTSSSNIGKIVLFTDQTDKYDFLVPIIELRTVRFQLTSRISVDFEAQV